MNVRALRFVLGFAGALVMTASLSFAGSWFGKSSTKSLAVTLHSAAKVNDGTMLKAGDYTIRIPENTQSPEVEFYTEGKLVAKAQAKVKTQPQKNEYTAIEITTEGNTNVVTALDPAGLREKLVFSDSSSQHGS